MGNRYHLYSATKWLDVSGSAGRLVFSFCGELGVGPDVGIYDKFAQYLPLYRQVKEWELSYQI